jgi:signal transduction histidine kinase/CheY-like chemotaxis protein
MVERPGLLARLPLGQTIRLALLALTLLLAGIAAIAIGNLYDARQTYEDKLAGAYQLEAVSSRLLAAAVIEEAALGARGRRGASARAQAAQAFEREAARSLSLATVDDESERLVRVRIRAQRRARRAAARPGGADELANALAVARDTDDDIAIRQRARRREAKDAAGEDSRGAVLTAAIAGGLALIGILALVGGLIASIRRPLEDLVGATRRLAEGDLDERVDPAGPEELSDLGVAFNAMAEDLDTARARIEAERHKLATTIESLGDALVVCDPDGVVTAVNPRAERVIPQLEVGARVDGSEGLPPLDEALEGEVMQERDELTFSVTASRLGDQGDQGVVWTLRDISERARLERIKSDFVATASHELRSPLTSIKGFVELLSRSEGLGEREKEFVSVILQSTDRLADLVNDLLDVARLGAGKMEVHPRLFELRELLEEVVTLMRPQLEGKGHELALSVPVDLPRMLADPVRVRQIVTNLVSNACQYTDPGGKLTVVATQEDRVLALAVSDNGRGMGPGELEHVFDQFVRREDGAGGTGLGLSIVRSLVELQSGSIEVDSEPGVGSTFTVRLPAEPVAGPGAPRAAIRGKRVLVVDDEPDVARMIVQQLAPFDVEAEVAFSGQEAIERLRAGAFDAMTLDMLMPGLSGLEVLESVRGDPELAGTPIVLVSILSGSEALFGEWKVTKPVDPEQLADMLGSAVTAGRTRVVVVARPEIRSRLEPALAQLGVDHEWVTSAEASATVCRTRRFEVALVDVGIPEPDAVMRALDLRGRRGGNAVVLFSDGEPGEGAAHLGDQAVPLEDAAAAVLQALGQVAAR